jgi:glutamine amidotransferase
MSRLFAYMANDPNRVACALYPARQALVADASKLSPPADSWGIGFYQGEVLLQRRPKPPVEPVDFYAVARELRTDVMVGHVRAGTIGKPKNENTHPFRFRSWMFAHHGTLPAFERIAEPLLAAVPDFLQRNIRGQTDSELLFHVFLGRLHDAGALDDNHAPTRIVRDALRDTLLRIEELAGSEAARSAECALAVTNGRILVTSRHGCPVHLFKIQPVIDCPVCRETQPVSGRQPKRIDHEHLRGALVIADPPGALPSGAGWSEVADATFVMVNHDLNVEFSPIYPS